MLIFLCNIRFKVSHLYKLEIEIKLDSILTRKQRVQQVVRYTGYTHAS